MFEDIKFVLHAFDSGQINEENLSNWLENYRIMFTERYYIRQVN